VGSAQTARPAARDLPRTHGIRYFHGCYCLGTDQLWGMLRERNGADHTLAAPKSIRAAGPGGYRLYLILDNLSANKTPAIRAWAERAKAGLCFTPSNASWANPIEPQFGPLRTFVLGGSDYRNHTVLARRLHGYLRWRNANARHPDVVPAQRRAQVMFLTGLTVAVLGALALPNGPGGRSLRAAAAAITAAGLLAAGTAVALAGTGRMDAHGMIAIPALHDAADGRPLRYTPVCSHTAIPVCLNPAYASYLPAAAAALTPVLNQIAGLPGAPARISQAAATYQQGTGNSVTASLAGPPIGGTPTAFRLLLPDQLPGPTLTTKELAAALRASAGPAIVASVIGDGPGASPAQHAVAAALTMAAGLPLSSPPAPGMPSPAAIVPLPVPVQSAAQRFAALPAPARHAWLAKHLAALRAGRITLAQLP
jgi:hypothetical protein